MAHTTFFPLAICLLFFCNIINFAWTSFLPCSFMHHSAISVCLETPFSYAAAPMRSLKAPSCSVSAPSWLSQLPPMPAPALYSLAPAPTSGLKEVHLHHPTIVTLWPPNSNWLPTSLYKMPSYLDRSGGPCIHPEGLPPFWMPPFWMPASSWCSC